MASYPRSVFKHVALSLYRISLILAETQPSRGSKTLSALLICDESRSFAQYAGFRPSGWTQLHDCTRNDTIERFKGLGYSMIFQIPTAECV